MNDSLTQNLQATQSIPDAGIRLTAVVIAGFIILVFVALIYFKMMEADKKAGI
jgi:CHASE3 domain sensor protein